MKRIFLSTAIASASIFALPATATAQDYPISGKPITMIVPFAPGGASDTLVRLLGQRLSTLWDTSVVVQNRPGGDMVIALQTVSRAEPDGHTISLTTSSFALNKAMKPDFPMDPLTDVTYMGLIGQSSYVLAVDAGAEYNSFEELLEATRGNSDKFNYASCCLGTYFAAEMIKNDTGLEGMHVPYKGSSPALNAMLAKDVQYIIDTTTATRPFVDAGNLKPLMVTGRKRSSSFPDVPHLTEAGVPGDYEVGVWYGFALPANTPDHIAQKANAALNEILAMPEVKSRIEELDIEVTPTTPEELTERVKKDLQAYTELLAVTDLDFGK